MTNERKARYVLPLSMLVAIGILGASIFYVFDVRTHDRTTSAQSDRAGTAYALAPITERDHIRGNPNAPVVMVEYSDFECPFCKSLHSTMRRVMDEYGREGKVTWVYRHFPIEQLHPEKAMAEAIASECAAEIGGDPMFWRFADRFFELTPSNNNTDIAVVIPQILDELGVDPDAVRECMKSGRHDTHIREDFDNAVAIGAKGTPWTVIITPTGELFPLTGGPPYPVVRALIEAALQGKSLESLTDKKP